MHCSISNGAMHQQCSEFFLIIVQTIIIDQMLSTEGHGTQLQILYSYIPTDIRRITNQPPLSSISKSRRLAFSGHLARMDENADASQAIFEPPPENWRRPPGRPLTTWMKNIHDDLSSLDLGIHEARDLAQNRPLCRMTSLHSATHSQWCMLLLDICLPEERENCQCVPGRILLSSVSINQNTFSSSCTTSNIRPAMKFKPCT